MAMHPAHRCFHIGVATLALMAAQNAGAKSGAAADDAQTRAEATVKAMTPDEKTVLTHGIMPLPIGQKAEPIPQDAVTGAGYIHGIARLSVPALKETDASLGVAYVMGLRKDGATALPSGVAMAATWNPDVLRAGGAMIGAEARAKGFNVLLAGGTNLTRDPRNGRTFEYLSEDPLLSGVLVGSAIAGVQSNHIISTIKHFALNGQETGRKFADVKIGEAAARESDLLAFKIGIEVGNPGAVMCSYNRIRGEQACASDYLLNGVLKKDWRYKGFVMSDWGAVPGLGAALKGLDQQSGAELDPGLFFADKLAAAAKVDPAYATRLDDMNRRILWAIYDNGLDQHPVQAGGKIDVQADGLVSLETAKQGIVLLRNTRNVLPLARSAKSIAVIGGYADTGVLSGGGSSQVQGEGGAAVSLPLGGTGPWASFIAEQYHRSAPVEAIKALAPQADINFRSGHTITDAVAAAKKAEVVIVFATKWASEGLDQPDLALPNGQDQLIAAVAAANPNTIVVLENGNPVLMPWLDKTAAVVEAWFPGARGGEAIASVLFGETNPSGHLPITFPASESQLPRAAIDGYDKYDPNFSGDAPSKDAQIHVNYDIEGSDVGYRWFARQNTRPLFPFGYGLSYTSFTGTALKTDGHNASFTLANTGQRSGATVGQLYLVSRNGQPLRRLVGFQRIDLAAAASQKVSVQIDQRLLADWKDGGWSLPAGDYGFALGSDAETLGPVVTVKVKAARWKD